MKKVLIVAVIVLLAGCATVPADEGRGDHWYFGLVRVTYPETRGALIAARVRNLGIGFDEGFYLGWHAGDFVFARPENCRIVIIVRDKADLAHAKTLIKGVEGACLVGK